jgi:outer membrane protein assembly factor BamB
MKFRLAFTLCVCLAAGAQAQHWPSFRGSNGSGVADGQNPPLRWDGEKNVNILWKTPLPGLGHSSPVVWGDRIFLTSAVSSNQNSTFVHGLTETAESANDVSKHSWRLFCLDKKTGRVVWERAAYEGVPKVKRHVKASYANATVATDGKRVVAFFGSEGLYCYDFDGKLIWRQDLGVLDGGWTPDPGSHWGFASSPVIYRNMVLVQCDTQTASFIAAYNIADGKQIWRAERGEDSCWSTPTIYEGVRAELIVSGTKFYRGYDPITGKELWRLLDGTDVKIPAPVVSGDLIYLGGGSSHDQKVFYALRAGASGAIAGESSNIAWRSRFAKPHIVTPLVYRGYLYVCTDNGVLSRFNAKTGEATFRVRIGGGGGAFAASPVAADGKIYFASEDGVVFVIKDGPAYELLATNSVGEVVMATPAITEGMLIVRGQHHVFAIREMKN